MSSLHLRLIEERERLGMEVEKFSEIGGVQKNAQYNYERGQRFPTARYLQRIAVVGVDVQYLLTGVRSHQGLTQKEVVLVEKYRQASDDIKEAVITILPINTKNKQDPNTPTSRGINRGSKLQTIQKISPDEINFNEVFADDSVRVIRKSQWQVVILAFAATLTFILFGAGDSFVQENIVKIQYILFSLGGLVAFSFLNQDKMEKQLSKNK